MILLRDLFGCALSDVCVKFQKELAEGWVLIKIYFRLMSYTQYVHVKIGKYKCIHVDSRFKPHFFCITSGLSSFFNFTEAHSPYQG